MSARVALPSRRLASIDVLKGVAILGVFAQHALTNELQFKVGGDFYIRQAVPVLFVLMGFNAARSALRHPAQSLREAYSASYWRGRFQRILLPFLVVFAAALVVGAATGRLHVGPTALVGALPVPGPGAYFVTILFTFAVIWPAWMHLFRRRPGLVVLASIALDVAFELAAARVPSFKYGSYPFGYDACILRYFGAIAVGMWLALDDEHAGRRRLVVLALAPLSLLYILVARSDPASLMSFLVPGFAMKTNVAAVPWAAALMLAMLSLWPANGVRGTRWLEQLGIASYEAFLVQIVWFGVLPGRGDVRLLGDAVVCGVLGWALHRALSRVSRPPARPAGPRRAPPAGVPSLQG